VRSAIRASAIRASAIRATAIRATAIRASAIRATSIHGTAICGTSTGEIAIRATNHASYFTGFPSHFDAITPYFYGISLIATFIRLIEV
jgi:hypothetical protein